MEMTSELFYLEQIVALARRTAKKQQMWSKEKKEEQI